MNWNRFFKRKTPETPQTPPQKPSSVPMFNQALNATKGVTDAYSAFTAKFQKLGALNFQAGIGYGLGFRHGFGLGVSVGVWNQLQSGIVVATTNAMMKFGIIPKIPFSEGALKGLSKIGQSKVTTDQISAESIMQMANKPAEQVSAESMRQLATKPASQISQGLVGSPPVKLDSAFEKNKALKGTAVDSASESQTQKVVPINPLLKGEEGRQDKVASAIKPEDQILQKVLKQRQLIEDLVEENEKLQQILQVKDLKTPSSKVQPSSSDTNLQTSPPSEVQDKITTDSKPPGDSGNTSPTPKGKNDTEKKQS